MHGVSELQRKEWHDIQRRCMLLPARHAYAVRTVDKIKLVEFLSPFLVPERLSLVSSPFLTGSEVSGGRRKRLATGTCTAVLLFRRVFSRVCCQDLGTALVSHSSLR